MQLNVIETPEQTSWKIQLFRMKSNMHQSLGISFVPRRHQRFYAQNIQIIMRDVE